MFNISGYEVLFLLILGLIVLGPEKLPGVIRKVMRVYTEVRKVANGFQSEVRDAFREPLNELRDTAQTIRADFGQVDPEPSPPMRPERAEIPAEDVKHAVDDDAGDSTSGRANEANDGS